MADKVQIQYLRKPGIIKTMERRYADALVKAKVARYVTDEGQADGMTYNTRSLKPAKPVVDATPTRRTRARGKNAADVDAAPVAETAEAVNGASFEEQAGANTNVGATADSTPETTAGAETENHGTLTAESQAEAETSARTDETGAQ